MLFPFNQWHEAHSTKGNLLKMIAATRHLDKLLVTRGPDRHDQSPARRQLFEEFLGQFGRRSRDENTIVGGIFRPTLPAITPPALDIVDIQLAESLFRLPE